MTCIFSKLSIVFAAIFGIFLSFVGGAISAQETAAQTPWTPFDRAAISFRVGLSIWENEARFNELLDLFDKYPGATDEITLFTEPTHTAPTVELFEKRLEIMKPRIAAAQKRGYRCGINILCTIGHHPEALEQGIGDEYPRGVTLDGKTARGTLCMNQAIFRDRVRRIYSEMAASGADYIWIDDDVRCGHFLDASGVAGEICFCDECMKRISQKIGKETTREELAPQAGTPEIAAKIREARADSIDELFALIEKTVREVAPNLPLGFMTGERYAEGYAFDRWAKTLAGPNGAPVYWRPGGGFYTQDSLGEMTNKSHEIGRQVSLLPPEVRIIESEIECFPYAPLQKSRRITALEAASYLGAGCSGAAFNVLTMNRGESLRDYEPLIAELSAWRPFYDATVRAFGRKPLVGVYVGWSAAKAIPSSWSVSPLSEIGLPIAYSEEEFVAPITVASPNYLLSLSQDKIESLLSRGLYTDVWGVSKLNDPNGFNVVRLTGAEWGADRPIDSIEVYSDDPINGENGEFAGVERDQRQSFWRDCAYSLHKTDPATRTLARLVDYSGQTTAETSATAFENELGGRVSIQGYQPWNYFLSRPKATQMKRLARWLSKDRLAGWVDSFERARLWIRADETGAPCAALFLNATYDDAEKPVLVFRTSSETATVLDRNGQKTVVSASKPDGPYRRFELPSVGAWDAVLVTLD